MARSLKDDPDRYIRLVKGGKYQVRPYSPVDGRRLNLGLFPTKAAARIARDKFEQGETRRQVRPKYVRRVNTPGGERHLVIIPLRLGEYQTEEEAVAAVDRYATEKYGPDGRAVMERETGRHQPRRGKEPSTAGIAS